MSSGTAQSAFKALHEPGNPVVLPNIYDASSLSSLLQLNQGGKTLVKATATASWAIAASLGIRDEELTLEQNLAAFSRIAPVAHAAALPISIDLQDGYGERIAEAVARAAELGAAGANIEDSIPSAGFAWRPPRNSVDNGNDDDNGGVGRARSAPEGFVLNARCDVFRLEPPSVDEDEPTLREAVERGKAYLEAGATTVFYWGGARGLRTSEVETLVRELGLTLFAYYYLEGMAWMMSLRETLEKRMITAKAHKLTA
ncbi:unnamed protein product [Parascedosporium putredinis]|uniref:Uncharacterized protein n=1 Tax=Parascedosporium putredinis TaxID=1442378 RepID=A0A9P1MC75_9PEZI|nr:unnamed protein product [Parascedosporium putredinis]CAI8001052.1 unnamed protein product [Parascedosporium putredinis]